LFFAAVASTSTVRAQPVDPQKLAIAQELYEQGVSALAKGDYAVACPKLEEVTRILPIGVGGLMALAHCYEGAGRLASAWTTYVVAQAVASQAARDAEEKDARARAESLKPKLARLIVVVSSATGVLSGLKITRDGIAVGAAQWGTPVPVDKGEHKVVATAEGKMRFETTFRIPADGASVSVDVPDLGGNAVKPTEANAPPSSLPRPSAPPSPPRNAAVIAPLQLTTLPARRFAGAVFLGAGAGGLAVGVVAGALVIAQHGSLAVACPEGRCHKSQLGELNAYHAKRVASTFGLVEGGVLAATGLLLLVRPKSAPSFVAQAMRF
jgi:hypothetical protein